MAFSCAISGFSPEAGRLAWAWRRVLDGALILLTPAPEKRDCPLSAVDTCPRDTHSFDIHFSSHTAAGNQSVDWIGTRATRTVSACLDDVKFTLTALGLARLSLPRPLWSSKRQRHQAHETVATLHPRPDQAPSIELTHAALLSLQKASHCRTVAETDIDNVGGHL